MHKHPFNRPRPRIRIRDVIDFALLLILFSMIVYVFLM